MTSKNGVHIEADSGAETVMDANGFVMSLTGRVRKPRSKVSKACDNCRKRKIKCNGKFPCASCEIYLCECTFTTRHGSNRIKNFQKANLNLEGATVQVKEETDSSSGSVPNPQLCADGPLSLIHIYKVRSQYQALNQIVNQRWPLFLKDAMTYKLENPSDNKQT